LGSRKGDFPLGGKTRPKIKGGPTAKNPKGKSLKAPPKIQRVFEVSRKSFQNPRPRYPGPGFQGPKSKILINPKRVSKFVKFQAKDKGKKEMEEVIGGK